MDGLGTHVHLKCDVESTASAPIARRPPSDLLLLPDMCHRTPSGPQQTGQGAPSAMTNAATAETGVLGVTFCDVTSNDRAVMLRRALFTWPC